MGDPDAIAVAASSGMSLSKMPLPWAMMVPASSTPVSCSTWMGLRPRDATLALAWAMSSDACRCTFTPKRRAASAAPRRSSSFTVYGA